MSQLFQELKRRNVIRVAIAYLAIAWVVLQVADIVFDNVAAPDWLMPILLFLIVAGFAVAVLFAWAYELTPDGLKSERDVDRSTSITHETGRKLDMVIIAVLGIAVAFLLVDKFVLDRTVATTDKSVAVLPFLALSSGSDDGYFADGLTEEILNSLTRLPELLVTARTSSFYFKGKDLPIPDIAATLGVAHVVEGSVRRDGERLRITAQLIRASDGFHLWSENYDHDAEDTFSVQTDIAEKIAGALDVVLDDAQVAKMRATGLQSPEAFIALQKGIELYDRAHSAETQVDALLDANVLFEKVLSIAPELSDAYSYHSDYFAHYLMDSVDNANVTADDRDAAIDRLKRDYDDAIRTAPDELRRLVAEIDRALLVGSWRGLPAMVDEIVAQPTCALPVWLDMATLAYEQADKILNSYKHQIECDPLNYSGWAGAIQAHVWSGDYDAAITMAIKSREVTSHGLIDLGLFNAYLAAARFDEAQALINREFLQPDRALRTRLALAAATGDAAKTKTLLSEFLATQKDNNDAIIYVLAKAGERELANQAAALFDSLPFGHLILMKVPSACRCGAPFDLEVTPNFAKLVEDAGLSWPPASPISWPLKDW